MVSSWGLLADATSMSLDPPADAATSMAAMTVKSSTLPPFRSVRRDGSWERANELEVVPFLALFVGGWSAVCILIGLENGTP